MKQLLFFTVFLFASYSSCLFAQNISTSKFYEVISLSKAIVPDSVLVGGGSASSIRNNGDFIYVDNSTYQVFHFSESGAFIKSFGREGRGPGDFLYVNDIEVIGNELYVLDYKNARFQLFDIDTGSFIRSIRLDFQPQINSEFFVHKDKIYLLGSISDNQKFIHVLDMEGYYQYSFGEFIDFSKFFMTPNGIIQLTQLHAAKDKDYIIYTLGAPYRIYAYDSSDSLKWEFEDLVIPKPWIDHIKVTPDSYSAKFYPTSFSSEIIGNYLLVYWINPETKNAYLDLRNKNNGVLIQRAEWDFENAIIEMKTFPEINRIRFLTKNRSTADIFIQELSIKNIN